MRKVPKAIFLIIIAALLLAGCSPPGAGGAAPEVGKPAPDFQATTLDGQTVSLSSLRGRPVLLNFWAVGCSPCRYEMPFIQAVFESQVWSEKGLVILAVNVGERPALVAEFVASQGFSFPVMVDTSGEITSQYRLRGYPTSFFIGEDGVIKAIKLGAFRNTADLERTLSVIVP